MSLYFKTIALVLLALVLISPVFAQTSVANNLERYTYQYVAMLYERGESEIVASEIQNFLAMYPQSVYANNVRLIRSNLHLEEQQFEEALKLYDEILKEDLEQSLRHQAYLYRAIALIGLSDFGEAMLQIQILESETGDVFLLSQANLQRARVFKILGQYYSAMLAYRKSLEHNPDPDIDYEYLEVLIKLSREDEALELLENISPQSHIFAESHVLWTRYLLDNNRFEEFDEHLGRYPELANHSHIELMRLRKAIALEEYAVAEDILNSTDNSGEYYEYFNALLLSQKSEFSEADFLFTRLVSGSVPDLRVLSYLERLKIIYLSDPEAAILQLENFIAKESKIARAEQLYTLGYFAFHQQDYAKALKHLSQARVESQDRLLMAEIDILIGRSWLLTGNNHRAVQSFNRYLNLYSTGKDRDTALYYLGYLYFESKDYQMSKPAFQQIVDLHPDSRHLPSAKFYLAEMDFYMANYELAIQAYHEIVSAEPNNGYAILRIAQIHYYLEQYEQAETWVEKLDPSYDSLILQGHIAFNKREFNTALGHFSAAEELSTKELKITEARSYQALCLYQMKRYPEATQIYLQLFRGKESPDTYLYLGAKSAYASGDYHLALKLFDDFVDTFPDSQYFLPVLADIANSYYNMGNYRQALEDYRSILIRFRNLREFSSADQALLREVFTGIELTLRRLDDPMLAFDIAEMADTFQSQYIRFELSYLVLKLYAEGEKWAEVLAGAEKMRMDFPQESRMEVELLMAESLLRLTEYEQADSLLTNLYEDTQDQRALLQWAEVDLLLGEYGSALQKYMQAIQMQPSPKVWLQALNASISAGYQDFEEIWQMGADMEGEAPQARLLRLAQLSYDKRFEEAGKMADRIINESLSSYDHATAFYHKALIFYLDNEFEAAIREFEKTLTLFPEFTDIADLAAYHIILGYLSMGAREEAQMQLLDLGELISEPNLEVLNELIQEMGQEDQEGFSNDEMPREQSLPEPESDDELKAEVGS